MKASDLEQRAEEVAELLKALGNARRLAILCRISEQGEASVGMLVEASRTSQPAVSQHLARMRDEGLITFRRDGHAVRYRISDPKVEELLATLHRLYCRPQPLRRTRRRTRER